MKKLIVTSAVLSGLILVGCGGEQAEPEAPVELETLEQKLSYLIAYNGASEMSNQGIPLEEAAYIEGIKDFLAGSDPVFTQAEMEQVFTDFQAKMQAEAQAEYEALAAENTAKSEAFLAENAGKEGVTTTESGLQYKVLEAGEGEMPTAESTVQVHYEGRLISGEVFDSSLSRGTPVEFGLTQVIPGWTEALQLMQEGAKWELYIPSDLAYGPAGGRTIGPNEALIFQVELLQANYVPEQQHSEETHTHE